MSRAMFKALFATALLYSASVALANGQEKQGPSTFGQKGYKWGEMLPEQKQILSLVGDIERGKEAFRGCRGCHKPDGSGLADGTYPRLSGQHSSVVIKQVTEVRAGIRSNPKMDPFASNHAVTPQEIADIAAYLEVLQTTRENGKGPGTQLAKGKAIYEADNCMGCHGEHGEGDAAKAYPVVASQHYGYLVREMEWIQKGVRGNSHPRMVKSIAKYTREEIEAVSDYMSRMPDYRSVVSKAN
jgi:cytochrome c553